MEETPFRSVFTKKSNFLTQSFITDPINIRYGGQANFLIPRHGDFITRIYLIIEYESVQSTAINQAHAMIDFVEFLVGGFIVQRETGETLNMRLNINTVEQQRFDVGQLYRMLGGGPKFSFTDAGQFPRPYKFMVPLDFWFNGITELAFPLAALRYQEVEVRLGLRSSDRWGGTDFSVSGSNCRLQIEYGYVTDEVLKIIKKKTYLYPTEQFQIQEPPLYTGDTTVPIPSRAVGENSGTSFVNPVKALFVIIQPVDDETNNVFDYSRGYTLSSLTNADGNDLLESMEINLDGETLLPAEVGSAEFLRGYQYYSKFPGATQRLESFGDRYYSFIYALALCRDPTNRSKINGSINFTPIKKANFVLKCKGTGTIISAVKLVNRGSGNSIVSTSDLTGISINDYVKGLGIMNDAIVTDLAPSGEVFYANGSNVTLKSNLMASYCSVGSPVTLTGLSAGTTVQSRNLGSGALGKIIYAVSGRNWATIEPVVGLPTVGDTSTVLNSTFEGSVTIVKGTKTQNISVISTQDEFIFTNELPEVGTIVFNPVTQSEVGEVASIYENQTVRFGVFSPIFGTVLSPTRVDAITFQSLPTEMVPVLKVGTFLSHLNLPKGTYIKQIIGNTYILSQYFDGSLSFLPGTELTFEVYSFKLLASVPTPSASYTFYPKVTFSDNFPLTITGGVSIQFGNKITLSQVVTGSVTNEIFSLPKNIILSLDIVDNSISSSREMVFAKPSTMRIRLYALSINFIFIENGFLKLVYDNSERALPRFT